MFRAGECEKRSTITNYEARRVRPALSSHLKIVARVRLSLPFQVDIVQNRLTFGLVAVAQFFDSLLHVRIERTQTPLKVFVRQKSQLRIKI